METPDARVQSALHELATALGVPAEELMNDLQGDDVEAMRALEGERDELRGEVVRLQAALRAARDDALSKTDQDVADQLLRVSADYQNYRKRTKLQLEQAETAGAIAAMKRVIPVLDALDHAISHSADDEGARLVRTQLLNALNENSIEAVDPTGEPFDPTYHEAITVREGGDPGVVAETFRIGYRSGETVLRAAQVIVYS